jgi:hypothetical protein
MLAQESKYLVPQVHIPSAGRCGFGASLDAGAAFDVGMLSSVSDSISSGESEPSKSPSCTVTCCKADGLILESSFGATSISTSSL